MTFKGFMVRDAAVAPTAASVARGDERACIGLLYRLDKQNLEVLDGETERL